MSAENRIPVTLRWEGGLEGCLVLLDQTRLPVEVVEIRLRDVAEVWEAIQSLRVRGAPAIGVAAAYGMCVGIQSALDGPVDKFFRRWQEVAQYLATSRPTAVNLFWALERMTRVADSVRASLSPREIAARALQEAQAIEIEDARMCAMIGAAGASLFRDGDGVLTHCNAGALATAGMGTALAPLYVAHQQGRRLHVFADETRPLLQGGRLTAWELQQSGLEVTLICDNMAAQVMREGRIQHVIVGADRIARNGDTANKIGTYNVAILARFHHIPFYVAAPSSTFDEQTATGDDIPIEQRASQEITRGLGKQTAPAEIGVYNPAFDVTPAALITAFITEQGMIRAPFDETLRPLWSRERE